VTPRLPVIIEGYNDWGIFRLNRTFLEERCGDEPVNFDQYVQDTIDGLQCDHKVELDCRLRSHVLKEPERNQEPDAIAVWLGTLQTERTLRGFLEYMDSLRALPHKLQYKTAQDLLDYALRPLYIHDSNLESLCPEAIQLLKVPRYFAHDVLHCMWPPKEMQGLQTFIGPAGSAAYPLHLNEYDVPFWMAQIEGHKSWVLLPTEACEEGHGAEGPVCRDQRELLTQEDMGMQYIFRENLLHAQKDDPRLRSLVGYKAVLAPGEVLYVPEGTIHQVENLDDVISVVARVVNKLTAPYLDRLISEGQMPYEQRWVDKAERTQRDDVQRHLQRWLRKFMAHEDNSTAIVHSEDAACRQAENCYLHPAPDPTNCPIIWDDDSSADASFRGLHSNTREIDKNIQAEEQRSIEASKEVDQKLRDRDAPGR